MSGMKPTPLPVLLLGLALLPLGREGRACHQPAPPATPSDRPTPTTTPGDFQVWMAVNRNGLSSLFRPLDLDTLTEYGAKKAPPEPVRELLPVVAYTGCFDDQVLEAAMRRLRANAQASEQLSALLADPSLHAAEKAQVAYALGELGAPRAATALRKLLAGEQDPVARAFAARALALVRDPDGILDAVVFVQNRSEPEAARCLVALSLAGCGLAPVRQALLSISGKPSKDESQVVRKCALTALGPGASAEELKLLEAAAEDRDPGVRVGALLGLALAGGRDAFLRQRMLEEKDASCRAACALGLGVRREPDSGKALLEQLAREADPYAAGSVALALGRFGKPSVHPLGEAAAHHRHCLAKYCAALGLGLTGVPEAEPFLVRMLGEQKVFGAASAGAAGLQLLGRISKPEPLLEALGNRQHAAIRQYAALALGRLKPAGGQAALLALLEDKSAEVRRTAAVALALWGDRAVAPRLEALLQDRDGSVRVCGALALDVLLQDDLDRPLALARVFKKEGDVGLKRAVDAWENSLALNRSFPPDYRIALSLWDIPQVPPRMVPPPGRRRR